MGCLFLNLKPHTCILNSGSWLVGVKYIKILYNKKYILNSGSWLVGVKHIKILHDEKYILILGVGWLVGWLA
jgi:hypothetical protein